MNPAAVAGLVLFTVLMVAATIAGFGLRRHRPKPPAPGIAGPPLKAADPPLRPFPAPGHSRHGGRVKTVELWADGRVVVTDYRARRTETHPGVCPQCADTGGTWNRADDAAVERLLRDLS